MMKFGNIVCGVLLLQCIVYAQFPIECPLFSDPNDYVDDRNTLENGLFECGDPNLTEYDFTPPIYWERTPEPATTADCYAALLSDFDPQEDDWIIANPYEGEMFVLLSTGGFTVETPGEPREIYDNEIEKSIISQEVFLYEGDTILGAYFFGTNDYMLDNNDYYNDYGRVYLDPTHLSNEPNVPIVLARCDIETVGSHRSTLKLSPDGWIPFSHTVEPNQAGAYYLRCEVADHLDKRVNSYFAVDALRICRGGKPLSDLNNDCDVNLIDYSILSGAWLSFCPDVPYNDPNSPWDPNDYPPPVPYNDPNILCQLADISNDWFVEPNDLIIMSNEWLIDSPLE